MMVDIQKDKNSSRKILSSKKSVKTWDVNVENITISKLIKAKTNYNYLIGLSYNFISFDNVSDYRNVKVA